MYVDTSSFGKTQDDPEPVEGSKIKLLGIGCYGITTVVPLSATDFVQPMEPSPYMPNTIQPQEYSRGGAMDGFRYENYGW